MSLRRIQATQPVTGTEFARSVIDASLGGAVVEWPSDATVKVVYEVQAWPTGPTRHTAYFPTLMGVRRLLRELRRFGMLEDNYFGIKDVYGWDWGPVRSNRTWR